MNIDTFIKSQNNTIPWTINFRFKGETILWNAPDTETLFLKNLQNTKSSEILKKLSWDTADISYTYNSNGFRDEEFDDRPCGIAIGCSLTEGIGLPAQSIWPSLLSEYTGIHVWNLGSGGASIETVFRIFDYYVVKLNPQFVCILMPPLQRFEYKGLDGKFPIISLYNLGIGTQFSKDWLGQEYNGKENQRKNMLAIYNICQYYKIPLFFNDQADGYHNVSLSYARDLMHPGVNYQQYYAEYMFNQIKNIGIV